MANVPLLLDTDIGTSLDDTICLAFIAASGAFNLVGLSTVTDDGGTRAGYARSVLHHYGLDVPVVAGAEQSLAGVQMQPNLAAGILSGAAATSYDGTADDEALPAAATPPDAPSNYAPPADDALIELYSDAVETYGGDLVVLSIGPLTNIARLVRSDVFERRGKPGPRLVCMAGSLKGEREWNVRLDPEAAHLLFDARPSERDIFASRLLVPIETTRRMGLPAEEAARRLPDFLTAPFGDLAQHPRHLGTVVLNDPLAALLLLDPGHASYRRGAIHVSLGRDVRTSPGEASPGEARPAAASPGEASPRGSTFFEEGSEGSWRVAVDVDAETALNAILAVLT